MKKKMTAILCATVITCIVLAGCGGGSSDKDASGDSSAASEEASAEDASDEDTEEDGSEDAALESDGTEASDSGSAQDGEEGTEADSAGTQLADGVYSAEFDTDSSMFHINEANEGRGVLTVENGEMTIHVSLVSKNIVSLFVGTAEDAQKDGADILEPTTDTVTYSDGISEEVYGFDIPVPVLDQEFDVALIGNKGKWYDHKVSVSDPQPQE